MRPAPGRMTVTTAFAVAVSLAALLHVAAPAAAKVTCNQQQAPQCGGGECRPGQACVAENDRCVCRAAPARAGAGVTGGDGTRCAASGPPQCGGDCSIECPAGTRAICQSGRCATDAPGTECVCARPTRCECD